MKQRSKRSYPWITIDKVVPLLALITAIPFAQAADLAKCPDPRPKDLSEGQWYACSHDDLKKAEQLMTAQSLAQGCGDVSCVQAKADKIYNLLGNSTWKYGDLKDVQQKLKSISSVCGNTGNSLQDCLQDNHLVDGWSTVDARMNDAGGTLLDIASGKKAQQDKASSDTRGQQMAAARKARALIFSTFAGNGEKQPDNLQSCFVEFQYQLPSSSCVSAHVNAANELLKQNGLQSVADKLSASVKQCRTQECFEDAMDSAKDAINGKYPDLDKDPVASNANVSAPSHAAQVGQAVKKPSKWSEMSTTDKINWFKAQNAADASVNQQLYLKYRRVRGCPQSASGVLSRNLMMMPGEDGLSNISKILTAPDLGASKVRAPASAPTIQYDDFDDQVE
jgi:hypothetical protein